jgi:ribonuclease D
MSHTHAPHSPSKDEIAVLPLFERLPLERITVVRTPEQALAAQHTLAHAPVWGFDTESKPTFFKDQVSDGPHVAQFATTEHAWVFQLHDPKVKTTVADLLAMPDITKAGFGLGDDRKRIQQRLGVDPPLLLDINTVFRERGYRKELGIKGAVAVMFGQQFAKSKKAATSNWSVRELSPSQVIYAANDAWGAAMVMQALSAS